MSPADEILVCGLEVDAQVGVPDYERATPQRLILNLTMEPRIGFEATGDDVTTTVDYDAVCRHLKAVAAERPRRLLETLAAEMADSILRNFPAHCVEVEIRKFLLEDTEYVGVRCTRTIEQTK